LATAAGLGVREHRRKFYQALVDDLIVFAEHEFRNARKVADGATESDHKKSAAAQWAKLGNVKAAARADPLGPQCPDGLIYLWGYFLEICPGLSQNGMGHPVVTWECLQAWCGFMRLDLEHWEARALVRLGDRRAAVAAEAMNMPTGST
jgi:hypothetical protein